jgi:hypothetical protein
MTVLTMAITLLSDRTTMISADTHCISVESTPVSILFEGRLSLAATLSFRSTDADRTALASQHRGEHNRLDRFRGAHLAGNHASSATGWP